MADLGRGAGISIAEHECHMSSFEPSTEDETIDADLAIDALAAIPDNQKVTVELCAQRYVISSNGIHAALDQRVAHGGAR
jgi:hypothetical protein